MSPEYNTNIEITKDPVAIVGIFFLLLMPALMIWTLVLLTTEGIDETEIHTNPKADTCQQVGVD